MVDLFEYRLVKDNRQKIFDDLAKNWHIKRKRRILGFDYKIASKI